MERSGRKRNETAKQRKKQQFVAITECRMILQLHPLSKLNETKSLQLKPSENIYCTIYQYSYYGIVSIFKPLISHVQCNPLSPPLCCATRAHESVRANDSSVWAGMSTACVCTCVCVCVCVYKCFAFEWRLKSPDVFH